MKSSDWWAGILVGYIAGSAAHGLGLAADAVGCLVLFVVWVAALRRDYL